jgi:uncharacterized protein YutE (UPF0331/DUF86 family)
MTRLEMRIENLRTIELALRHALEVLAKAETERNNDLVSMYQYAVVRRFETFYEITWKVLKDFLEQQHISIIPSPKKIFHMCRDHGIIAQQEANILLEIIDFQIKGAYAFDESLTTQFAQKIARTYYPLMQAVIYRIAAK